MCEETDFFSKNPGSGLGCFVVHTRPRVEKKAAELASSLGRPVFLPLYEKPQQRRSGRGRVRHYRTRFPLFPGYLFARLTAEDVKNERLRAHVAGMIPVTALEEPVLLRQLQQVKTALEGPYTLEPYEYLKTGATVSVSMGPLKGLEGYVVCHKDRQTFVVQVDLVGRAVSIDVDAALLRVL
ncbi:MAG: transcription termination/antitermination NusG family protein [Verrucomicrobiae bacterium]|nr:transcription termination/antitermination NusG family protein [Verrucomicrobiae bacterium]